MTMCYMINQKNKKMTNVIDFPGKKTAPVSTPEDASYSSITEIVREELEYLSSNQEMTRYILERMKPFISTLQKVDLDIDIEITSENESMMISFLPSIQNLQARFDSVILDMISERILLEIQRYHSELCSEKEHIENALNSFPSSKIKKTPPRTPIKGQDRSADLNLI